MLALNFQEMTEHKVKRGWYRLEHYKVELKNKLKCLIFTLDVFFSIKLSYVKNLDIVNESRLLYKVGIISWYY